MISRIPSKVRKAVKLAAVSAVAGAASHALIAPQILAAPAPVAKKPNIVFILADDLGWKDLGCYGSYSYKSPNIDRLAKRGMLFNQCYAYSSCSPTRASLMTGMDPARIGMEAPVCHQDKVLLETFLPQKTAPNRRLVTPECITRLDTKYITYAKQLKEAGYVTAHIGKWHLGREPYSPLEHGFDVDIPHLDFPGPGGSYVAPWNKKIMESLNPPPQPGEHLEDRMAKEAAAFIEKNKNKPFLLDYWAFSVHSQLSGKDEYVKQFKDIANGFTPQRNPVYAAMIKSLDDAVGTLMDALEKAGVADNTIIIFSSDNGATTYYEHAVQHPEYLAIPISSNTPLRAGKGWIYEGGVRVPLIVSWPGVTKPDSVSNALVSIWDLNPTFLEMCGREPIKTQPLDGISFVSVLKGTQPTARTKAFCVLPQYVLNCSPEVMPPAAWVREGDWKLLRFFSANPDGTDRVELYNLKDDIGETFDMSTGMPGVVATLSKKLETYIKDTNILMPQPNPNYNPTATFPVPKRMPSTPFTTPVDD